MNLAGGLVWPDVRHQPPRTVDKVLETCDRLLSLKIDNAEGWILKGIALYELGRFKEAISAYDHALMVDPRHAKVYYNRGIALAVDRGMSGETVKILSGYQEIVEEWLCVRGFRSLAIPPDSDRRGDKYITRLYRLFSHKAAATCSGLGWIGKNGLIINGRYGSKLSWASVLTDAPLDVDAPVTESQCGECELCVKHCPSGAISGNVWSRREPMKELVRYDRCRSLKGERRALEGKPNCGLCIAICPYSRGAGTERTRIVREGHGDRRDNLRPGGGEMKSYRIFGRPCETRVPASPQDGSAGITVRTAR